MRAAFVLTLSVLTGCFADRVSAPMPTRVAPSVLLHIPSPTAARIPGSKPRIFLDPEFPRVVTPYEMVVDDRHYNFPRDSVLIQRELAWLSPKAVISIEIQHGASPRLGKRRATIVIRTNRATTLARFPSDLL
jgi:hypothetical protein